jgi:hypothetical protein
MLFMFESISITANAAKQKKKKNANSLSFLSSSFLGNGKRNPSTPQLR